MDLLESFVDHSSVLTDRHMHHNQHGPNTLFQWWEDYMGVMGAVLCVRPHRAACFRTDPRPSLRPPR